MTLGQHFLELRKRLMVGAVALVIGVIIAFAISDLVIHVVTEPIRSVAAVRGDHFAVLNFETVTSAFDMRLRIAFAMGTLISAPIWLWQLWAFFVPGLTRKEIRYTIAVLAAAIPLFFAGSAAGLIIMPHIVELMATFVPEQGALFYTASYYYDFVFKLLIVVGVAFVTPVFLVAMNLAGVVTGRAILRGWRIAVLIATLFAAIATPAADVASMAILAGALIILFFGAAFLSLAFDRRAHRRQVAVGSAVVEAPR